MQPNGCIRTPPWATLLSGGSTSNSFTGTSPSAPMPGEGQDSPTLVYYCVHGAKMPLLDPLEGWIVMSPISAFPGFTALPGEMSRTLKAILTS